MAPHPSSSNGYGSLNGRSHNTTAPSSAIPDEESPLLPGDRSSALKQRWRHGLTADIRRDWTDLVLLVCYIITGLLDSAAISTWGSFVSMQTGNTIYLGLGLASPSTSTRWLKSGTSIAFFCLGSIFFSSFHRAFSPKRRWVLCASFLVQTAIIVAAAAILQFAPMPDNPQASIGWTELVPIALIAFQSCGQAVTSRAVKHNALTSVVLTSIYLDLFSDVELFAVRNVERNRRVAAPLLLLAGAVLGGTLAQSSAGFASALWISAALKLGLVAAWFVWPAETEE
ncbi:hypothetical protein GGR50DRAFT_669520 [Xylaria sp. CBS 124048]|nr:hypothetical protein GGR50DRAFT_669520 [Xylaria sp. CBS 124048]